jgi:hypothetical protein
MFMRETEATSKDVVQIHTNLRLPILRGGGWHPLQGIVLQLLLSCLVFRVCRIMCVLCMYVCV